MLVNSNIVLHRVLYLRHTCKNVKNSISLVGTGHEFYGSEQVYMKSWVEDNPEPFVNGNYISIQVSILTQSILNNYNSRHFFRTDLLNGNRVVFVRGWPLGEFSPSIVLRTPEWFKPINAKHIGIDNAET